MDEYKKRTITVRLPESTYGSLRKISEITSIGINSLMVMAVVNHCLSKSRKIFLFSK